MNLFEVIKNYWIAILLMAILYACFRFFIAELKDHRNKYKQLKQNENENFTGKN